MESRQITVFGGSGFLGRYVVRALAKKGWRIKVATRRPNRAFFLRPMGQVGQIGFLKCDVTDADDIERALAGSHAAVNLTGILYQRGQTFEDVHAKGPEAIAIAAARLGLRALVHVSAIGADLESDSHYAETKAEGEKLFPPPPSCGRRCCSGLRTASSTASPRWRASPLPCP